MNIRTLFAFFVLYLLVFNIYGENSPWDFDYNVVITTEGYFHTDTGNLDWNYDYFKRKPFISLDLLFEYGDFSKAYAEYPIMKDRLLIENSTDNYSNIVTDVSQLDMNFPYVAYFLIGNPYLNMIVGRDLLKVGSGLLLNPNAFYHDHIKLTANISNFTYNLILVYVKDDNGKVLLIHSGTYRIPGILSFSVTEGELIGRGAYGLELLNPFTILHDEYLAYSDSCNALSTINISTEPLFGLSFTGELAVDQYATSYEAKNWTQEEPNAWGWVLGANYKKTIQNKEFYISGLFIHTDPYFGIDSSDINFTTTKNYVTHSQVNDDANGIPVVDFLGIGADRELTSISMGLDMGKININLEYNYNKIGENDASTSLDVRDEIAIKKKTPSGDFDTFNTVTLGVNYSVNNNLNLSSEISYMNINNKGDFQFVITSSYTF